jgi:parallel beta-helix repeat protein
MKRSLVSLAILTFIFVGLLGAAFKLHNVEAEAWTGTVYIRADGSVDPSDAPVLRNGNMYTLTGDIVSNANGIVIERDNVTLDGAGHVVQGKYAYATFGVYLVGRKNVTISNARTRAFWYCVRLDGASNNNNISGNTITDNHVGIGFFFGASNNRIFGNTVRNNTYGIWFKGSANNTLRNNAIDSNTYTFNIDTSVVSEFTNDVDTSNTVNGKPIYYWINKQDMTMPADAGYVALINCTNITVQNLNFTGNGQTILMAYTVNSTIARNRIAAENGDNLYLFESSNNSIFENEIAFADATSSSHGIWLFESSNNIIVGNDIANNMYGIETFESSNNKIYHNNFVDNTFQVYDYSMEDSETPPSFNVWNDGYPSGGNYWSNYHATDIFGGSYQNETGTDGVADAPYIVNTFNRDRYPLMGAFSEFHVAQEQIIQAVCNSTISNFQYRGNAIVFDISGKRGTVGFCRICIPTALINGTYWVFVNGKPISYILLPYSNSTYSYLYFTYAHSTHEVIITNSPGVPILPFFAITLTLSFIVAALIIYFGYKKEQRHYSKKQLFFYFPQ